MHGGTERKKEQNWDEPDIVTADPRPADWDAGWKALATPEVGWRVAAQSFLSCTTPQSVSRPWVLYLGSEETGGGQTGCRETGDRLTN